MTTRRPPIREKGKIEPVLDALKLFGHKDSVIPLNALAAQIIETIARVFNHKASTFGGRQKSIQALENVGAAGAAYATALRSLDKDARGYLLGDTRVRRPDGGRYDMAPAPVDPTDDIGVAFAPEIRLAAEDRPNDLLAPTLARAEAVSRRASIQRRRLFGEVPADLSGRNNAARDGLSPKDFLVEACFLLVAGCYGPAGVKKIKTSAYRPGVTAKAKPPFADMVSALYVYATGDANEGCGEGNFDRTLKTVVPYMRATVSADGTWHSWIALANEPTAADIVELKVAHFMVWCMNTRPGPPSRPAKGAGDRFKSHD